MFVHRVGSRVSQTIFALAAVDATLLFFFHGWSILDAFRESKAGIQHGIVTLVIMAAGFMFLLQQKRYGIGLLLVAVYVVARDALGQALFGWPI
jgi:hypothetical protein